MGNIGEPVRHIELEPLDTPAPSEPTIAPAPAQPEPETVPA